MSLGCYIATWEKVDTHSLGLRRSGKSDPHEFSLLFWQLFYKYFYASHYLSVPNEAFRMAEYTKM